MTKQDERQVPKAPTGISGLDQITGGGLPKGRPTLVCGGAGCGKTLLATEIAVRGAVDYNEPGVILAFEENAEELTANVRSLGFDLDDLVERKKLVIDHVHIERREIEETGEFDLEGLFIRLDHAVKRINAKRVVLDTLEALFAGLPNEAVLRAELRRLFRWLKDRGLTAVITAERGESTFTRYGLEEYVADCVILLDHRVREQVSTRRLRIVKYRGTQHGTNEYPFIITPRGISVMPITSLLLEHNAQSGRIPTGIKELDDMLTGGGYHRGSSILVTGSAGSLKTSIAAAFVNAACARGERCVYFAFEESVSQIVRNMRSIGIDLERWIKKGLLLMHASRPTLTGLEQHLVMMYDLALSFKPDVVVVDPISNLALGTDTSVKPMLMRLVDHLKVQGITALYTSLTGLHATFANDSEVGVSSLMDTWLVLRTMEEGPLRYRVLVVLKARGTAHSAEARRLIASSKGLHLAPAMANGEINGAAAARNGGSPPAAPRSGTKARTERTR